MHSGGLTSSTRTSWRSLTSIWKTTRQPCLMGRQNTILRSYSLREASAIIRSRSSPRVFSGMFTAVLTKIEPSLRTACNVFARTESLYPRNAQRACLAFHGKSHTTGSPFRAIPTTGASPPRVYPARGESFPLPLLVASPCSPSVEECSRERRGG